MRFSYGSNRWVILTKNYAIKIARIRPIRPFVRLSQTVINKNVKRNLNKHDRNLFKAVFKYLMSGVVANRHEYRFYKKYSSDLLAPTLFTICWLINVQVRGEPVEKKDIRKNYLWKVLKGTPLDGELRCEQFGRVNQSVCLVDYGAEGLEPFLVAYKLKNI